MSLCWAFHSSGFGSVLNAHVQLSGWDVMISASMGFVKSEGGLIFFKINSS